MASDKRVTECFTRTAESEAVASEEDPLSCPHTRVKHEVELEQQQEAEGERLVRSQIQTRQMTGGMTSHVAAASVKVEGTEEEPLDTEVVVKEEVCEEFAGPEPLLGRKNSQSCSDKAPKNTEKGSELVSNGDDDGSELGLPVKDVNCTPTKGKSALSVERQAEKFFLRGRIVGMRAAGLSPRNIAAELGLAPATVYRWLRRWSEEGNLLDRPRPGKARRTTAAEDQKILEEVERNPFTNAVAIRAKLQLTVSAETVRKRLHEMGCYHRQLKVSGRKKLDAEIGNQDEDEDLDDWDEVIFANEKIEKLLRSTTHGKLHSWRRTRTT